MFSQLQMAGKLNIQLLVYSVQEGLSFYTMLTLKKTAQTYLRIIQSTCSTCSHLIRIDNLIISKVRHELHSHPLHLGTKWSSPHLGHPRPERHHNGRACCRGNRRPRASFRTCVAVRLLQQVTKKMCDLWENKTGKYIHLSIYLPTY